MSILSGIVTDETGEPLEGSTVTAYRKVWTSDGSRLSPAGVAVTDASGTYRILSLPPGDYVLQGTSSEAWTVEKLGHRETVSSVPTFYPGVGSEENAQAVHVPLGQELAVDFALVPGRAVSVSGVAYNSKGEVLANKTLFLAQETITTTNGMRGGIVRMPRSTQISGDGSFRFKDVPPGKYKIELSLPPGEGRPAEAAAVPITISDVDVDGLSVVSTPGAEIRGSVETETGRVPPFNPSRVALVARSRASSLFPLKIEGENGKVQRDWTFVIRGVVDPALIRPVTLPEGWFLKNVYVGARDLINSRIDPAEVREPLRVVLTDKVSVIDGTVVDRRGTPVDDFTVLIFPVSEESWTSESRFIRTARPDQNHRYRITNIPAGEYYLVGLDDVDSEELIDPGFLQDAKRLASHVVIGGTESQTINLTLDADKR